MNYDIGKAANLESVEGYQFELLPHNREESKESPDYQAPASIKFQRRDTLKVAPVSKKSTVTLRQTTIPYKKFNLKSQSGLNTPSNMKRGSSFSSFDDDFQSENGQDENPYFS